MILYDYLPDFIPVPAPVEAPQPRAVSDDGTNVGDYVDDVARGVGAAVVVTVGVATATVASFSPAGLLFGGA